MKLSPLVQLHLPQLDSIWNDYCKHGYTCHGKYGLTRPQLMELIRFKQEQKTLAGVEQPEALEYLLMEQTELLGLADEHMRQLKLDRLDPESPETSRDYRDAIRLKASLVDSLWQKARDAGIASDNAFVIEVRQLAGGGDED